MSDGTVLGIALALVASASLGIWWLWHQRRSQRPTPLKKVLMVVVALTCLLLLTSASAGFRWLWLERRGRPVTSEDLRILTRADEILRDESVWNRQDDRECTDDNARGQWKPYRAWFGTFCENIVQGTARDVLAAAIDRCEARGWPVVLHCHDEITIEVLSGTVSDVEFLDGLLELPDWAAGLPLSGKVHSGPHYLEAPKDPAEPLAATPDNVAVIEAAIDAYVGDAHAIITIADDGTEDDPHDYVDELPDHVAPLHELVSLPLTPDGKGCCPFHEDAEPSCKIYPDHYYCFGCGAHGNRIDWLVEAEGYSKREALVLIKDWRPPTSRIQRNGNNEEEERERKAFIKRTWLEAVPIAGTIAAQYLDETRHIDLTQLPNVDHCLRFHPDCCFGPNVKLPCLLALMRDEITDYPLGIQRTALQVVHNHVEKIERKMLGKCGVVKIWRQATQLVVGEGLETVLAAATRIPFEGESLTPAWAALASKKLAQLPLIDGVKRLIVLVDNDVNQEGQLAASCLVETWRAAGREVVPLIPEKAGEDFNDVVIAEDNANVAA